METNQTNHFNTKVKHMYLIIYTYTHYSGKPAVGVTWIFDCTSEDEAKEKFYKTHSPHEFFITKISKSK